MVDVDWEVRRLVISDVDRYLRHVAAVDAGSGVDGAPHSHPYSRAEPLDLAEARVREFTRWATETDEPGWRRAWGLFDRTELVGHLYLAGGALRSELHRAEMGMGVIRSHRRQGGGTLLLRTAIAWASARRASTGSISVCSLIIRARKRCMPSTGFKCWAGRRTASALTADRLTRSG